MKMQTTDQHTSTLPFVLIWRASEFVNHGFQFAVEFGRYTRITTGSKSAQFSLD
jgi:hypothetical protein